MGKNLFTPVTSCAISLLVKKQTAEKSPLIITFIVTYPDFSLLETAAQLFAKVGLKALISRDLSSEPIEQIIYNTVGAVNLMRRQLPDIILRFSIDAEQSAAVTDDFRIITKKLDKEALKTQIASIKPTKKLFLSTENTAQLPKTTQSKISVIDDALMSISYANAGSILSNKNDFSAIIQQRLVPHEITQLMAATLMLSEIITKKNEPLESLDLDNIDFTAFPFITQTRNGELLVSIDTDDSATNEKSVTDFCLQTTRSQSRQLVAIIGKDRDVSPFEYEHADILILLGDKHKDEHIEAAREKHDFVLNDSLYWFADGKQLSFHLREIMPNECLIFIAAADEDNVSSIIEELS